MYIRATATAFDIALVYSIRPGTRAGHDQQVSCDRPYKSRGQRHRQSREVHPGWSWSPRVYAPGRGAGQEFDRVLSFRGSLYDRSLVWTGADVAERRFTFIDLFAGIGGFHAALTDLGGRCVYAAEKDPQARAVYREAWLQDAPDDFPFTDDINKDVPWTSDQTLAEVAEHVSRGESTISDRIPKEIDVLAAGFPCQTFSKSGKQHGVLDKVRGTLFYNILRIVAERKPKIVFLENVRNLVGPRHRDTTFKTIIDSLISLEYVVSGTPTIVSPHRIRPEQGGGPQARERVYIMAIRNDLVTSDASPFPGFSYGSWSSQDWQIAGTALAGDGAPAVITEVWANANRGHELASWRLSADLSAYKLTPKDEWYEAYDSLVRRVADRHLPGPRGSRFPGHPIWFDVADESWRQMHLDDAALHDEKGEPREWKRDFIRKSDAFYANFSSDLDCSAGPGKSTILNQIQGLEIASWRKFEWQAGDATTLDDCLIQLRPSGVRVKQANYAPALVAINQTPIIGSERRRITALEAGRLQGFPGHVYKAMARATVRGKRQPESQSYKQFGNAVHVGAVKFALAQFVRHHLGDSGLGSLEAVGSQELAGLDVLRDACRRQAAWTAAGPALVPLPDSSLCVEREATGILEAVAG